VAHAPAGPPRPEAGHPPGRGGGRDQVLAVQNPAQLLPTGLQPGLGQREWRRRGVRVAAAAHPARRAGQLERGGRERGGSQRRESEEAWRGGQDTGEQEGEQGKGQEVREQVVEEVVEPQWWT